jgi:hypothetical protein
MKETGICCAFIRDTERHQVTQLDQIGKVQQLLVQFVIEKHISSHPSQLIAVRVFSANQFVPLEGKHQRRYSKREKKTDLPVVQLTFRAAIIYDDEYISN